MTGAQKLVPSLPFVAFMTVSILVELAAAWLAYHTVGAVFSGLLFMAVAINLLPVVLFVSRRQAMSLVIALILLLAIVPYQAVLGHRMISLQQEASGVVSYAYETKLATGEFPADLSGYKFGDEGLQPFFQEYRRNLESGGFSLFWYIGTPSTSHYYTPLHGWGYYPD